MPNTKSVLKSTSLIRNADPAIRGKFRAITTKNKNFIGITEHVADNNVKSIWDVKVLTREGFWLKLGDSSNTVTGTNGLRFARKEIAAAMQSTVREKVGGKLWKSNISPMGGKLQRTEYHLLRLNEQFFANSIVTA